MPSRKHLRGYTHWVIVPLALALLLNLAALMTTQGATSIIYYKETGHYVRGAFRDYWDKHGGLANFGYPLTEEYIDPQSGRIIQYFERARFERAQSGTLPVQLGLLGREMVAGRSFAAESPIANTAQRRYFAETKHIVQYGFKEIWETRGGLAVFGLPLSGELEESLGDNQIHTIQWFERVRFEYWPNLPAGQRVLISSLGRQLAPASLTAPLPADSPPSGPIALSTPTPTATPNTGGPLQRPLVPESKNAQVVPQAGQPGTVFVFVAGGFAANEQVSLWVNRPDDAVVGASFRLSADDTGLISPVQFAPATDAPLGVWSFVAHGISSKREAVGYFLLIGGSIGQVAPGPGVPPNVDARADPVAGPPGTIFFFDAYGFRSGEDVQISVTRSDGQKQPASFAVKADTSGSIRYAGIYYTTGLDYPMGLYTFAARGVTSNKTSTAYFVLKI